MYSEIPIQIDKVIKQCCTCIIKNSLEDLLSCVDVDRKYIYIYECNMYKYRYMHKTYEAMKI